MNNIFLRIISIILLSSICTAVLFACADSEDNNNDTAVSETTASDEIDEDSLGSRNYINDNIPALDFEGKTFQILACLKDDIITEQETGDVVNDAMFNTKIKIEDRFNTVINVEVGEYKAISTQLSTIINAGDDSYQLYSGQAIVSGQDAVNGRFLNFYELPYINFEQPWWPQYAVKALILNSIMFLAPSTMNLSMTAATYCMFYDKTAAEKYNITGIYDTVNSGEWTLDRLWETTKTIYSDLNGDGNRDKNDYYGFTTDQQSNVTAYVWAFDMKIVEISENYEINLVYQNDKNISVIDRLFSFFYETESSFTGLDFSFGMVQMFQPGHALFTNGLIGQALSNLRDYENDYGIIPYPKWDSNQENYYTMVDGGHSIIGIPLTVADYNFVGAITEAYTAESWKVILPAYYDVALKLKGTRDDESIAMLDLILGSQKIDFSYIYDGWTGFAFATEYILRSGKPNLSSYYAQNEKKARKYYEKIMEAFENYGL